jgi:hypothetical protein
MSPLSVRLEPDADLVGQGALLIFSSAVDPGALRFPASRIARRWMALFNLLIG